MGHHCLLSIFHLMPYVFIDHMANVQLCSVCTPVIALHSTLWCKQKSTFHVVSVFNKCMIQSQEHVTTFVFHGVHFPDIGVCVVLYFHLCVEDEVYKRRHRHRHVA